MNLKNGFNFFVDVSNDSNACHSFTFFKLNPNHITVYNRSANSIF